MTPRPHTVPPEARSTTSLLPPAYTSDLVMQGFAVGIDALLAFSTQALDTFPLLFDPWQTPSRFLSWLERLSGARTEPGWSEQRRRAAIDKAGWLSTRRGTPDALITEARDVYGWSLVLTDPGRAITPGAGWPPDTPLRIVARTSAENPDPLPITEFDQLERLVRAHCPAYLNYTIVPLLSLTATADPHHWALVTARINHGAAGEIFDLDFGDGTTAEATADESGTATLTHTYGLYTESGYTIQATSKSDPSTTATAHFTPRNLELTVEQSSDLWNRITAKLAWAELDQDVTLKFGDGTEKQLPADSCGHVQCDHDYGRPGEFEIAASQGNREVAAPVEISPDAMTIIIMEEMTITITEN